MVSTILNLLYRVSAAELNWEKRIQITTSALSSEPSPFSYLTFSTTMLMNRLFPHSFSLNDTQLQSGGCLQQKEKVPADIVTFSVPEKVKNQTFWINEKSSVDIEVSTYTGSVMLKCGYGTSQKICVFCHWSENFPIYMSEIWGSLEFMARLAFYSHLFYLILLILVRGRNRPGHHCKLQTLQ